jgi:riboflavin synthase
MFTGIISDTTDVVHSTPADDGGLTMTFARPASWHDMRLGESIATNGVCLTAARVSDNEYDCFLMPETLHASSFGSHIPAQVNLERPLGAKDRFGGHFVQGHVDCVGVVTALDSSDGRVITIGFPEEKRELVIPKGSITIDGVSLTVVGVSPHSFSVALIPHTLKSTTLKDLQVDDKVNLEFDMIGKYIVNIMEQRMNYAKSPTS